MPRVTLRNKLDVAGADIFTMDVSAGAANLAGFDGTSGDGEIGVTMTRTHLPTGGPTGGGAYRFTWVHDASQNNAGAGYGGEYYLGWGVDTGVAPSVGSLYYTRLRFRIVAGSTCAALDSADGTASYAGVKALIVGDGASGRTILEVRAFPENWGGPPGPVTAEIRPAADGAGYGSFAITLGTWYSVQIETLTGAGGHLRLWGNNNVYASPDIEQTGLAMGAATYDQVGFGYYSNRMIASGASFGMEYSAFEVATTFDAGWA